MDCVWTLLITVCGKPKNAWMQADDLKRLYDSVILHFYVLFPIQLPCQTHSSRVKPQPSPYRSCPSVRTASLMQWRSQKVRANPCWMGLPAKNGNRRKWCKKRARTHTFIYLEVNTHTCVYIYIHTDRYIYINQYMYIYIYQ